MTNLTTNPAAWIALALAVTAVVLASISVRIAFATHRSRARRLSAKERATVRRFGLDTPERSDG